MWQLYIDLMLYLRVAPYLFSPAGIKGWTGRMSTWMSCWWRTTSWSAGCLRRKKWDVLVSICSLSEWSENARGYCCNLRSCTDSNRNMLPARKNQDTFVIILSISRGPDLMNHNRAIIVVSTLKPDYDLNTWRAIHRGIGNSRETQNSLMAVYNCGRLRNA